MKQNLKISLEYTYKCVQCADNHFTPKILYSFSFEWMRPCKMRLLLLQGLFIRLLHEFHISLIYLMEKEMEQKLKRKRKSNFQCVSVI